MADIGSVGIKVSFDDLVAIAHAQQLVYPDFLALDGDEQYPGAEKHYSHLVILLLPFPFVTCQNSHPGQWNDF